MLTCPGQEASHSSSSSRPRALYPFDSLSAAARLGSRRFGCDAAERAAVDQAPTPRADRDAPGFRSAQPRPLALDCVIAPGKARQYRRARPGSAGARRKARKPPSPAEHDRSIGFVTFSPHLNPSANRSTHSRVPSRGGGSVGCFGSLAELTSHHLDRLGRSVPAGYGDRNSGGGRRRHLRRIDGNGGDALRTHAARV